RQRGAQARTVAVLQGHTAHATAFAFSQDGNFLATGSVDASLRIWDLNSARPVDRGHWRSSLLSNVSRLAFEPGQRALAVGSGATDGGLYRWTWAPPEAVSRFPGHSAACDALAYSSAGGLLAV